MLFKDAAILLGLALVLAYKPARCVYDLRFRDCLRWLGFDLVVIAVVTWALR